MKQQSVKKIVVFMFAAVLLAVAVPVASQQVQTQDGLGWWGSSYTPGNITAGVMLGAGFNQGFNLEVYPNFERKMFKWRPGNLFAVDFGLGMRGLLNLYTGDDWYPGHFGLGAGPYGSLHFGFRGFGKLGIPGFELLERVDLFTTFGVNYQMYMGDTPPDSGIHFSNFSGLNYFVSDMLAVSLFTNYHRRFDNYTVYHRRNFSGGIGIQLRFGPTERLTDPPNPTWLYFQSVYVMSIGFSGGFYDDATFNIGDEATFRYVYTDRKDGRAMETTTVRTLLHRYPDGRSWWRITLDNPELRDNQVYPLDFEVLINDRHDILRIRYIDVNSRQMTVFDPDDPSSWRRDADFEIWGEEKIAQYFQRSERVQVPAGTFQTDVYLYDEDPDYEITLWISKDVPSALVKVEGQVKSENVDIEGELMRIRRGVTSPWTPAW